MNEIEDWSINISVKNILFLMSFFKTIAFIHIDRKFNQAVHFLAKFNFVHDKNLNDLFTFVW